ncbi:unnamed protein product, partial [Prorocentrum cordatum]
ASNLLGGGRTKDIKNERSTDLLEGIRKLLDIHTAAPQQHPAAANHSHPKRKPKPTLHDALRGALGKAKCDQGLLGKLRSIHRAVDAGHITLGDNEAPPKGSRRGAADGGRGCGGGASAGKGPSSEQPPAPTVTPHRPDTASAYGAGKGEDTGPPWALSQREWSQATVSKQGFVLAKLRNGELPSAGHTACLAESTDMADEMLALWRAHHQNDTDASLTVAVVATKEDSWQPDGATGILAHLTLVKLDKQAVKLVKYIMLGKAVEPPASPTIKDVKQVPKRQGTVTVRLTVFADYLSDKLSLFSANQALKVVWPAAGKGMLFGCWRPNGTKGKDPFSYTMYVTGTPAQCSDLFKISGKHGVFVQHLASFRDQRHRTTVAWVARPAGLTPLEYRDLALQEGNGKPLVHRMGGGPDLGYERGGIDARQCPPHIWRATTPRWWRTTDLESFLEANDWQQVQVLTHLSPGSWRVRAGARPLATTTYRYEAGFDDDMGHVTVLPLPRKVKSTSEGRTLRQPDFPWLDTEVPAAPPQGDAPAPPAGAAAAASDPPGEGDAPMPAAAPAAPPATGKGADQQKRPGTQKTDGSKRLKLDDKQIVRDANCLLDGMEIVEAGGRGACGYCSIVAAGKLTRDASFSTAAVGAMEKIWVDAGTLRVQTAQLLKKNSDVWKPYWAQGPKHISHTGHTFDEYVAKCSAPDFWMDELQLNAASAELKRRITVVYRDGKQGWARRTVGHQHKSKGWFVLLLDESHYRAVRPPTDGFPASLCEEFETYLASFLHTYLARELADDVKRLLKQTVGARRRWASQHQQATPATVEAQRVMLNRDTEDLRRKCYYPGDLYACPRGWRAKSTPAAARANARQAERHWRSCQPGTRWEALDDACHQASLAPMRDPAIQDRKVAKAWERHQTLRASMPASIARCAHDLDGATAQKLRRAKGGKSTFYTCRRCGGSYVLASVWKLPCPAIPPADRPTCVDFELQCRDAGSARSSRAMAVGTARTAASHPGPPRFQRRPQQFPTGMVIWGCNVNGLKDNKPVGDAAATSKWARVQGQALAAGAHIIGLVETHMDSFTADRFGAQASIAGFSSYLYSSGTARSRGVALLGPPELRADPWAWEPDFQGRVVSELLHSHGQGTMLVVVIYADVHSQEQRQRLCAAVAARVAAADLPAVVFGDYNCEPMDEETASFAGSLDCAHHCLPGGEPVWHHTHGDRFIDYAVCRHLVVNTFGTDTAISDHKAIVFSVQRETEALVQTIQRFVPLEPPANLEEWDSDWKDQMHYFEGAWDAAEAARDPARIVGKALRCAAGSGFGVAATACARVFKNDGFTVFFVAYTTFCTAPGLVAMLAIDKGLQGLVRDGILPSIGDSSPAAAAAAISAKLEQLHAAHKETRLQEWRRRQQEGNMKTIYTYVSGKKTKPTAAARGTKIPAALLARAPRVALELLGRIGDLIRDTGRWPSALRSQEVAMIPKPSGEGLRPIGVAQTVARAFKKIMVEKYKRWAEQVQPTNATAAVLLVDFAIDKAYEDDAGLVVRQSDLSNCFTRLQAELVMQVAGLFGMHDKDAVFLFSDNSARNTVVKVAGYASDSMVPGRGLAQGDPGSPLGAAILAGAHARRLAADHDIMFTTYVDDRTMTADAPQEVESAADTLAYLDWLSGQEEDPGKLAVAAANVQGGNYQSYVDVLGVRLDLSGANPPEAAPRALRRAQELLARLTRIQRISWAARLPRRRVRQVVLANIGILRWDAPATGRHAPWCVLPDKTLQALRAALETALAGRRRYASWRHRGAAWNVSPKAWKIEPMGVALHAAVGMLKRTLGGPLEAFVRQRWRPAHPAARPSAGWLLRTRELLDSMGWRTARDPFEVEIGDLTFSLTNTTRSGLDHMVREAWRSCMMQAGEAKVSKQDVVNIHSLDGKVLRDFLDSYDNGPDHSWAWRCVVGGEPSPDRLHHVDNAVAQDCAACRTRATARHILWQCPATEAVRHSRGLRLPELAPELPEPERSALLLNGWIRAAWDVPAGVSSDRILAYKVVVVRPHCDRFLAAVSGEA